MIHLDGHPKARCYVLTNRHDLTFVSYYTTILTATPISESAYSIKPLKSGTYWDGKKIYTATTARHISNFLAEYFPDVSYQEFKNAAYAETECIGHLAKGKEFYK